MTSWENPTSCPDNSGEAPVYNGGTTSRLHHHNIIIAGTHLVYQFLVDSPFLISDNFSERSMKLVATMSM